MEVSSLIAHTFLRVSSREDWYFDSGFSRHVTGVKSYLKELKPYSKDFVTFGDGIKGRITGIDKLVYLVLPSLENVMLVEGPTVNSISLSQLCYQGLRASFKNHNLSFTAKGKKWL